MMMDTNDTIRADIKKLLADGVPMDEIVVNHNDDTWGDSCAITRSGAQELVDAWIADTPTTTVSVDELMTAEQWLMEFGAE